MTTSTSVLFYLTVTFGFVAASSESPINLSPSICAEKYTECDQNSDRPFCGTDGKTYDSKCFLFKAKCAGVEVNIQYPGSCKECLAAKNYAMSRRRKLSYIPKCRDDGSYASVQCLDNNQCWCVNSQGKPTSQTSYGKPTFCPLSKETYKRSSSPFNGNAKKKCTPHDRSIFNSALLAIFHIEYMKSKVFQEVISDDQLIDWKIKQMDINNNNILEPNEYLGLKKIARTIVKPKRCGRRLGKFCDTNKDMNLTREEFQQCLSKDAKRQTETGGGGNKLNGLNSGGDFDDDEYGDELSNESSSLNRNLGKKLGLKDKATIKLRNESDGSSRDLEEEINDCLKDRKNALEDKTDQLFLPECTVDGRFKRVQCYRSTGYCWCVNEDNGKPITGSSTKDKQPLCDNYIPIRQMPGCPQKNEFLKELKEFLKTQALSSANIGADNTKWGTEDEKIATLSFVLLDKNKNKVWERKEWKTFRELVSGIKKLRRCGKRLPRFCDINNDKKITLSEWLNCLQTQRNKSEQTIMHNNHTESSQHSQSKVSLKGVNPLEFILKAD